MSDYVTRIRTESGDLQIDYNALANLPTLGALAPKDIVAKKDLSNEVQASLGKADTALQESDKVELQSEINNRQATITGGASTITSENLTPNRVLVSNGDGKVAVSDITSTELNYLDGVSSNLQKQLDEKPALDHKHTASDISGGIVDLDMIPTIPYTKISGVQVTHIDKTATLAKASWSSLKQTVSVNGVTADNTIIVTPAPASFLEWRNAGVYCSGQTAGKLTFTCETVPTVDLTANIVILN